MRKRFSSHEKAALAGAGRFEVISLGEFRGPVYTGHGPAVPVTDPAHRPANPIFASTIPPNASSAAEASPQPTRYSVRT